VHGDRETEDVVGIALGTADRLFSDLLREGKPVTDVEADRAHGG
jgi:hypothetical protein